MPHNVASFNVNWFYVYTIFMMFLLLGSRVLVFLIHSEIKYNLVCWTDQVNLFSPGELGLINEKTAESWEDPICATVVMSKSVIPSPSYKWTLHPGVFWCESPYRIETCGYSTGIARIQNTTLHIFLPFPVKGGRIFSTLSPRKLKKAIKARQG